jgi:hypothetical protein
MHNACHPTKPTVVLTGKLNSTTLHLAGKAGIPRSGVAGVLIRFDSTGERQVKGADSFGNGTGTLDVVPARRSRSRRLIPARSPRP